MHRRGLNGGRVIGDLGWAGPARRSTPAHVAGGGPEVRWMFEAGLPDPATFPAQDLGRITLEVLRRDAAGALGYGDATDGSIHQGFAGLRDALAERGNRIDGTSLDRRSVMLTSGAAQALMLTFEAFLDPGDVVAVEAPTWNAVLAALQRRGAEVVALPLDDDGLDIDALQAHLVRLRGLGQRLKMLYTIATFNTPTGVCLSQPRRRRLLELASEWDFIVVEDNVYGDLRFEGDPLPSLFGMDESGVVIKVDSFSKVVAPGLRMGWLSASSDVVATMAAIRGDLGVSQLTARVLARYLDEGLLEPHIVAVNDLYRAKRDVAETALRTHCGAHTRWRTPEGGFFLWVELDSAVDAAEVMRLALKEGVSCRAGERFFGDSELGRSFFRMAFPSAPIDEIEAGVAVVGEAIAASVDR